VWLSAERESRPCPQIPFPRRTPLAGRRGDAKGLIRWAGLASALSWLNLSEAGAVAVSFLTLAFAQLFHVFNLRDSSAASFLDNDVARNPYVWPALFLRVALLVGSAYLPLLSSVLELEPPEPLGWAVVLMLAFLPLLAGEAARRLKSADDPSTGDERESRTGGRAPTRRREASLRRRPSVSRGVLLWPLQPVDYRCSVCPRTTTTELEACRTTESETLPISARLIPPSPRLPTAMSPAPTSSARATISSSGRPIPR
jgi:hypothetical protein